MLGQRCAEGVGTHLQGVSGLRSRAERAGTFWGVASKRRFEGRWNAEGMMTIMPRQGTGFRAQGCPGRARDLGHRDAQAGHGV